MIKISLTLRAYIQANIEKKDSLSNKQKSTRVFKQLDQSRMILDLIARLFIRISFFNNSQDLVLYHKNRPFRPKPTHQKNIPFDSNFLKPELN